jgi:4'-phosphopantetheinyl transferase
VALHWCDLTRPALAAALPLLSPAERERCAALVLDGPRHQYACGRAFLRQVLAAYLGAAPAQVPLLTLPGGKPALAGGDWQFNLAHSGGWCVVAVARRPVGVDVEYLRPLHDLAGLAARLLTPGELAAWWQAAPADRLRLFVEAWTAHEARFKCGAAGHGQPLAVCPLVAPPGCIGQVAVPGRVPAALTTVTAF